MRMAFICKDGIMSSILEIQNLIENITSHLGYDNVGLRNYNLIMNPCVNDSYLKELEQTYDVALPEEYREYLLSIGNGGNQPGTGMFAVEQSLSILFGQECNGNIIEYKDLTKYYHSINLVGYKDLLECYYDTFGQDLGKNAFKTKTYPTTLDDFFYEDGTFIYQNLLSENEEVFIEYESAMKTHMLVFSFENETRTQFAIAMDGNHKEQVVYYSYEPCAICMSQKNIVFTEMSFLEWMQHLYECNCDPNSIIIK